MSRHGMNYEWRRVRGYLIRWIIQILKSMNHDFPSSIQGLASQISQTTWFCHFPLAKKTITINISDKFTRHGNAWNWTSSGPEKTNAWNWTSSGNRFFSSWADGSPSPQLLADQPTRLDSVWKHQPLLQGKTGIKHNRNLRFLPLASFSIKRLDDVRYKETIAKHNLYLCFDYHQQTQWI